MSQPDPKHLRAAALLVEGRSVKDAARAAGIRPETLSRWKGKPDFQALVQDALARKARGSLEQRLAALSAEALDLLAQHMKSRDLGGHPSPRAIEAAGLILQAAILNPHRTQERIGHDGE